MKANRLPTITLLTDFGQVDHYLGVMKGVILGICPEAQIVDISHEVTPFAVAEGAFTLGQAWKYFPAGTVHVAVVDPGVGSARRPIVVEAGGHFFVGPDNGIFDFVYSAEPGCRVREITASQYFLRPVSRTFHGRDIFSPVAAHLGNGVPVGEFGPRISEYVRLDLVGPQQMGYGTWAGVVLKIDRFGNLITNLRVEDLGDLSQTHFELHIGKAVVHSLSLTYTQKNPGQAFLICGSSGLLEISVAQGNAAAMLSGRVGQMIELIARD